MRTKLFGGSFCVLGLLTSACIGEALEEEGPGVDRIEQEAYYDATKLWGDGTLSVCWLSLDYATERAWVREAVENAFEAVAGINFTGWGLCSPFIGANIVISHRSDVNPHADIGSRTSLVVPNIWLNHFNGPVPPDGEPGSKVWHCFTGNPDSATPRTGVTGEYFPTHRQRCIEVIAVHEFAHALALEHEQGRADRPTACPATGGASERTPYGYFDWTSISNYCNPAWNGDGLLSPLDISWLVETYGMKTNDHVWYGIGNIRDYGDNNGGPSIDEDRLMFDIRSQSVSGNYSPQIGDFNRDGRDDVFWYQAGSGSDEIWWGRADRTFDDDAGPSVNLSYRMTTGDFDDDGSDDIFLHAPGSAADKVLWGRTDETFDSVETSHNVSGTYIPLAGDFDGDTNSDVFFYAAGSTMDGLWWGKNDRTFERDDAPENVNGTYIPIVGDFDGDTRSDIFWYEPGGSDAEDVWWGRSDRTFDKTTSSNVSGTYSPTAGDFDGNGADDIIWSKSNDEQDPVYLFSDTTRGSYVSTKTSSVLGSNPYAGDFDGDGLDDVFWYVGNQ
jgi:hypothetical protein